MLNVFFILGGLGVEGVGTIALSYLEAIDKNAVNLSLVIAGPADSGMLSRAQKIGISIFKLPYRKAEPGSYYIQLYKLLKKEKPEIVHIHGNSATMALDLFVAALAGVPVRLPHCHNTTCDNENINALLKPLLYFTMSEGLACGEDAGKWLYGKRTFKVLKNGRNLKNYEYNEAIRKQYRAQLGLTNSETAIGHVGTFTDQKNQIFLIEVLREINDSGFKLFLYGDGPLKSKCEDYAKEVGIEKQVFFMGNVNDIGAQLNAMDIMTLPSKFEGLPLVTIEWQTNGLPCLISSLVTRECKIMDNVRFEDITEEERTTWVQIIRGKYLQRDLSVNNTSIYNRMTAAGFNIYENAKWLVVEYNRLYRDNGQRR